MTGRCLLLALLVGCAPPPASQPVAPTATSPALTAAAVRTAQPQPVPSPPPIVAGQRRILTVEEATATSGQHEFVATFYCFAMEPRTASASSCHRALGDCEKTRSGMSKSMRLTPCEGRMRAACYDAFNRLYEKSVEFCYMDFAACERLRSDPAASADWTVENECEARQ